MKVPIVENVLKFNDEIAAMNRHRFAETNVYVLDLIGAPGSGKTELLVHTLRHFPARIGVIVGDLATTRDAERLMQAGDAVVQINTGKGCHLDANQVRRAMEQIDLDSLDVLFIENVGNLICPVGFDLGQHAVVGMFALTDGDDKAAKHPHLVRTADALILNKMDLAPHVPFDLDLFTADVRHLNADAPLLEVSAGKGALDPWLDWLRQRVGRRVE